MSAITVNGDIVHYEVLGRGKPVVLVHGWVGSWRYWIPIMQQLHLKYRVYALDLFGFGDSAKNPDKYTIDHQVSLLSEFMTQMGLTKAALIGHGLGAQVVVEFSDRNRDKVPRLMLASAPLFDPGDLETRGQRVLLTTNDFDARQATLSAEIRSGSTAEATLLRRPTTTGDTADATIANSRILDRAKLEAAAIARAESEMSVRKTVEPAVVAKVISVDNPLMGKIGKSNSETLLMRCFKKTDPEYAKLTQDVSKQGETVLNKMAENFDPGRLLDILRKLPMPVVVVHGMDDPLIDAPSDNIWAYITNAKEDLLPVPLPGVRHFPMLEADSFARLVNSFLEIPDISKLEIKERWRRRSR
ncbi:MAG: alpha/beta hydrolase [Armatimonadetes bacterium]|nr:alpha/beta hydrolase [Anaerolineae bacterium]